MQARCQRARGEDRGFVEQGDALVLLLLVASEPSPMRHEGVAQFAPQRVDVRPLALEVAHALVGQLALGFGGGAVGHRRLSSRDRKSTRLELQSLMRISYAVFCLKNKKHITQA